MPIASTRPNSVRLFRLKPIAAMTANVPTIATGTATSGMIADRQFCRNSKHDEGDQDHRVAQGLEHLVDRLGDERRRVVDDRVVEPVGEALLELLHLVADQLGGVQRVGAGQLIDRERHRGLAVERAGLVVVLGAQLDRGHVAQPDDAAAGRRS